MPECEIIFDPEIERSQAPPELIDLAGRQKRVAMVRCMICWSFLGLGVALTSPIASASAEADPAAELAALGARCSATPPGRSIGVDLSNAWVTDADLAKLARLPQLREHQPGLHEDHRPGLEHLAPLKNVKVLDLYYAESVTDLGIAHLKHWKNLEHLNLRGTKVTSSLFEHVAKMTKLRFLDVGHSRVNDDLFELLESLDHLEHLSFGGNKMSGAALPLLKSLPALKELSVSGQQRTDSGLWSVSVTDFNIGHIAQLRRLEVLDLGETNVSDRGVAELARLKNLHTLDLRATRVTGKGIAALAGLPELRHLKLWKARGIDDAAVPVLLQMESLEVLELPETSITARGLAQLAAKRGLKQLFIGGIDITPEQAEALRQALPDCLVSWWRKPTIPRPEPGRRGGN